MERARHAGASCRRLGGLLLLLLQALLQPLLLDVPLLRAELGHGPDCGSFIPDKLLSTPGDLEATAQCPSNVIELTIQTWLPLQVELIGLKMHHDGAGHNCT